MKKIAVKVSLSPADDGTDDILNRLKSDFALLGGELSFYGEIPGGVIRPVSEMINFSGIVIDLNDEAGIVSEPAIDNRITARPMVNNVVANDVKDLKITVEGVFLDKSGYALHTRNMALGLDEMGADVQLNNMWFGGAPEIQKVGHEETREDGYIYLTRDDGSLHRYKSQVDPEQTARVVELCQKEVNPAKRTFIAALPPYSPTDEIYRKIRTRTDKGEKYRRYIGYTMFETADLPHGWAEGCDLMDEIWVPSSFNYESFARGGISEDKLRIVPLGVDVNFFDPEKVPPMEIPGLKGFNFLSIFQWTKRKGWDILLKAYLKAFSQEDDVALVIRSYRGAGREVESLIREYIEELGHDVSAIPRISVISEPIVSQHMPSLYKACDAFILPTRGEGWGLPYMEAMAMGMPVIGTAYSAQLDFMNRENSYLIENMGTERVDEEQVMDNPQYMGTSWGIPSLEHTIELMREVYENRDAAVKKGQKARQDVLNNWTVEHQVKRTAETLLSEGQPVLPKEDSETVQAPAIIRHRDKPLRIAMQNRPNTMDAAGGDTVVMQNLKQELEKMGMQVDLQFKLEDLSQYDIVHIYNFVLPEMLKLYVDNALKQNKPSIITPMYEDWPKFQSQSFKSYYVFKEYIEQGQPKDLFEQIAAPLKRMKPHPRADNGYNVRMAGGITPSGPHEAERIREDYPFARNIVPVYLGCDITESDVSADLFYEKTGLKDFVLCVARAETKKNELMLMKALEDEDIPIVFAIGDFTYQGPYLELCQKFKRRGKTIFLDRLSDEMLVSVYKAAKVHALPSWYELPGMVSVEAAHYDCNVVASPWGTIEDYLGDFGYYCEPDDPEDIRRAVIDAMNDPVNPAQKEHVKQFTWKRSAELTLEAYQNAIEDHRNFNEYRQTGDELRSNGDYRSAFDVYRQALDIHPDNPETLAVVGEMLSLQKDPQARAYLTRLNLIQKDRDLEVERNFPAKLEEGWVFAETDEVEEAFRLLNSGGMIQAEAAFLKILETDGRNSRVLFGLGKIEFTREKFAGAKEYFQRVVDIKPGGDSLIALAETLEKLNDIDQALTSLDLLTELPGINGSFEFDVNRLRGHCNLKKGNYDEAERCYNRARIIDRTSEKPYLGLGSIELIKQNHNVAEQYYRKALELNPDSDKARLGLAVLKSEQGRASEAFNEAKSALDLRIENQQAMMLLIKTGHESGRLMEAEKYLAEYSSLHPANIDILYTLAGIRYKLGREPEALETARRILIFDPGHDAAADLIDKLDS